MQIEALNLPGGNVKASAMWDGALRIVQSHGRYADAVARGSVFSVADIAGQTIPSGLNTAPATTTLWNPPGSGVFCSVLYGNVFQTIIWAAVAAVWVGVGAPSQTSPLNTAATMATNSVGGRGLAGSRVVALTPGTGAILLPTTPTIIADLGAALRGAVTTLPYATGLGRWFDGLIGIPPGGTLSFQASAVGPTSGSWGCWIWEEVPMSGAGTSLTA